MICWCFLWRCQDMDSIMQACRAACQQAFLGRIWLYSLQLRCLWFDPIFRFFTRLKCLNWNPSVNFLYVSAFLSACCCCCSSSSSSLGLYWFSFGRQAFRPPKPMSSAPTCPGWRLKLAFGCGAPSNYRPLVPYRNIRFSFNSDEYACRQMCMLCWPSHRLVMLSERVPVLAFSGQLRGNRGSWLSSYPCSSLGMFPDALSTILHCSQVAEVTSALVPTAFTKVSECFHPWWIAAPSTGSRNGLQRCL